MNKFDKVYKLIMEDIEDLSVIDNEFSFSLSKGDYSADLEGTIDGDTINWRIEDYNYYDDSCIDLQINGERCGERKIGEGQTANMALSNLYEEFKDAFNELDIPEYDGWDDQQQENQDFQNW